MKNLLPLLFHAKSAQEVQKLHDAGYDINTKDSDTGHTPLHLIRSYSAVKELLRLGADVSIKSKWMESVLHKQQYNSRIVAALIAAGADVNAQDEDGDTPLHMALSPTVVLLLLKNEANPDIRNIEGKLPEDSYGSYSKSKTMRQMIQDCRKNGFTYMKNLNLAHYAHPPKKSHNTGMNRRDR